MNTVFINNNITLHDLELEIRGTQNKAIKFQKPAFSIFGKIKAFFSSDFLVQQKIESLIKENIKNQHSKLSPQQVNAFFEQILLQSDTKKSELKTTAVVRKVLAKALTPMIENNGSQSSIASIVFPEGLALNSDPNKVVQNVLKVLLGAPLKRQIVTPELLRAVFVRKNSAFLLTMVREMEAATTRLYNHLIAHPNEDQEKLAEIFIGNILALYPFAEPAAGFSLKIPQKIDGKWHLVEYSVEVLSMTSRYFGNPMPAFGLKPVGCPQASPLLLFRGSPQFTASGAIPAWVSDVVPGYSVGEYVYEKSAKKLIQSWITQANEQGKKVKIFGQSLGGALALIAVSRQPDKVSEVHVYGSPGLLKKSVDMYERRKNATQAKPQVHQYWNAGDLVPMTGYFHPDWHIHKVVIPKTTAVGLAHAGVNIAQKDVVILKSDAEKENRTQTRKTINIFHQLMSVLLLPLSLTLLGFAFTRTALRYIGQKVRTSTAPLLERLNSGIPAE
jgi:Alpha/beta hydrolase